MMFERGMSTMSMIVIVLVHVALLGYGARVHSPTFNEIGHLPAGISHWHFNRYELYRVNPPLVRMVAAAPVYAMNPKTNWTGYNTYPTVRSKIQVGVDFVGANGPRSFLLYFIGRLACIPFSCIGLVVCYLWSRDLFGEPSGLLAATLWCFSPLIVGHGSLIMPDVPAASLSVLSSYLFWRWSQEPNWLRAVQCGVALGLAILTKTTVLVLLPILVVIGAVSCLHSASRQPRVWLRQAAQITAIHVTAFTVVNLGYGFNGSFQSLGNYHFSCRYLTHTDSDAAGVPVRNRFSNTPIGSLPVPLPADFVLGIDQQKSDFDEPSRCYLRGTWKIGGWWYFYLYGLAVKLPAGTSILMLLALCSGLSFQFSRTTVHNAMHLLLPPAAFIILVSSQTNFTVHLRYVIPALPFLFVWAGRLATCFADRRRSMAIIVACCVAWSVTSSLWSYPHSLSYFNELAGGPKNGHNHLLDSNSGWGQDVLLLKRWADEHPEAHPLHVASFGWIDPRIAGLSFGVPPVGPVIPRPDGEHAERIGDDPADLGPLPGWYVIDVNHVHGTQLWAADGNGSWFTPRHVAGGYAYFSLFEPTDSVGYSMLAYHLTTDEVNHVRTELGMAPL